MKLNINKLQEGGSIFKPFTPLDWRTKDNDTEEDADLRNKKARASISEKKLEEEKDGKFEILSKSIKDNLITKALPSEMESLMDDIAKIENQGFLTSQMDTGAIRNIQRKANILFKNAEILDNAMKSADKNNGSGELAVTDSGTLFVKDKYGTISKKSLADYQKNRKNFQALTVAELATSRIHDNSLAFDQDSIETIQNSVGLDKISDYILGIVARVGNTKTSTNKYTSKQELFEQLNIKNPTTQEQEGLQQIGQAYLQMGPEGIYNIQTESENQSMQINNAYSYLLSILPNQYRTLLRANAVENGNIEGTAENIIKNALQLADKSTYKATVNYETGLNKEEKEAKESMTTVSPLSQFLAGDMNVQPFQLKADKNSYGLELKGSVWGQMPGLNGQPIQRTTIDDVLTKIGIATDKSNIFIGNKPLKDYDFGKVFYDGKQVVNTMLPVNDKGNPDLELADNYSNALKSIESKNITKISDKNTELRKYGVYSIEFGVDGELTEMSKQYMKPFMVMYGYTTTGLKATENNEWAVKKEGSDNDAYKEMLTGLFEARKLVMPEESWGTKVVEAPIFIPILPEAQQTVWSHDKGFKSTALTVQQGIARGDNPTIETSSDQLNN